MTPNRVEPQEVYIPRSLWEPVGTCGLQTRIYGRPHKDCSDSKFGSTVKCQIAVLYLGTYGVLQEAHQKLCLDHHADGEVVEKRCRDLLE